MGHWPPAGPFTTSNDTGQTLAINSVALTFSNPDLFSVAEIEATAGIAVYIREVEA